MRLLWISVAAIAAASRAMPQAATAPAFEVASIKLHVLPVQTVGVSMSGPSVRASAMSLSNLVAYAYDLKSYQIVGSPSWADSDRYDIAAKADGEGTLTRDQVRQRLQPLLADRFQLKFHHEMKEMSVYALVAGKNGPKLKESAPDATTLLTLRSTGNRTAEMTVSKGDMGQLARQFSNGNGVDRPVLDRTGLSGTYDYKLTWAADPPPDSDAPSIFTALQEQLGLKLEPTKAPIDTLVIDHAEKPSEN
jgi:uncharacterized protein (TIGR03435 family)